MAELVLGLHADPQGQVQGTIGTEFGLNWIDAARGGKRIVLDGESTADELRKIADWSEHSKL